MLEAVVLAGGTEPRLAPLTSSEQPKCLLPVANTPVILYSLTALKQAGITTVLVVASGEVASAKIQTWVKREPRVEGMSIRVVTAAADSGSADAVRAVADKLTGDSVVVMSGDTVTDVSLPTVLFTHRIRGSSITTVLSKSTSSASESTKLGKAPKGVDYVAIDPKTQRILTYAYDPEQLRKVSIPIAAITNCSSMTVTTDYRDACIYILSARVIKLIQQSTMSSIKVDGLPKFVNDQWRTGPSPPLETTITPQPSAQVGSSSATLPAVTDLDSDLYQQELQYLSSACPDFRSSDLARANPSDNIFCGAYIADSNQLCRRVNTLQSLLEVNREMAERMGTLLSLVGITSAVHPSITVGNKTVVALGCLVGENTSFGDKTSVKRSVIGNGAKIGANVKIHNSLIMNDVVIGDQVHIQNSTIGQGAIIKNKAQLKDCIVGHNYVVAENSDHRDEKLASDKSL